jgi:hypothetical protein
LRAIVKSGWTFCSYGLEMKGVSLKVTILFEGQLKASNPLHLGFGDQQYSEVNIKHDWEWEVE